MFQLISTILVPIIAIVIFITIFAMGYVKAPTDKAYIISGFKKKPRILIGRAGIKIPFLERKDELLLKQISIDIKTNGYIPTQDFIGVDIDAVAKVRMLTESDITVGADGNFLEGVNHEDNKKISKEMVDATMRNFLNMREDQIREALTDSLQGNMREIIGTQNLKELCNDRKKFGDEVQAKAQKDMNALGIWIESCNIQKIEDEKGLITALGQDNMSKIQKEASIAKAQADRDVAIAQADAEKASNDARVLSQTEIARKNNELEIEKAQLKIQADKKRAIADTAYEIEKQEQMKAVNTATVDAQIAKTERETKLREQEVAVQEQALAAEIKKKADAEKYATEQAAAAILEKRKREAEAEKYEKEREADAKKAQAEAEKFAMEQEAAGIRAKYEAEAAGIKTRGEAEAEAIRAKGLAEAEAMEKKAEAYQKYNKAAMAEMLIGVLPEIAGKVAEPLQQIDKITIIGGGEENGVGNVANYVPTTMAKVFETIKATTGIDLGEIVKADTYEAKVTRNVNLTGIGNTQIPESNKEELVEDIIK